MIKRQQKLNLETTSDDIAYFAAFSYMLTIKPIFKTKLLEYFNNDIKSAFYVTKDELKDFKEHNPDISIPRDFLKKRDELNPETCFKEAFLNDDVKILTANDEKYPNLLKQIPDYPISLYYKGDLDSIDFDYNLAVVGSRMASDSAKIALYGLISEFQKSNITIVSGLAYGIDAIAHEAALKNNLKTIAVIGSGLDIIYPKPNKQLFNKILENNGVIFSEYPLKTQPMPQNFPQRNRIVVGLSKGTLVAEAKLKSGAMISANLTLEYNRELMCMPGDINNPNTQGIYHLIKNGAGIITNSNDILEQLNWEFKLNKDNKKDELTQIQKDVIKTLELEAKNFDEIINNTGKDVPEIMVALTELEIKGLIKQLNNKYYKC